MTALPKLKPPAEGRGADRRPPGARAEGQPRSGGAARERKPLSPLDQVDPIVRRLVPVLARMVRAEVEQIAVPAPRVTVARPDAEIMRACRKVAEAVDQLEQAKFSGAREIPSRQALIRSAQTLRRVMERHGRFEQSVLTPNGPSALAPDGAPETSGGTRSRARPSGGGGG